MGSEMCIRDSPSAWCLPGFFVVKGDGKSVRLVTDYTKLNSYVNRPVHPFPSVIDILQTIPSTAQIFAKFDAVNGYFQISLDQQSSDLTTFILPSGPFAGYIDFSLNTLIPHVWCNS